MSEIRRRPECDDHERVGDCPHFINCEAMGRCREKTAMEICQTCFGSGYHHRFARNWPCPNGCLPPGNRISEQLSAYGIAKIISSHAPMNAAFAIVDLIQSERSLARSGFTYPHMCRDGHPEIGHSDNSSEMCPLCRARADTDALRMCCDNAERSYMAERDNSLRLVAERDAARADADGRVAEVLEAYSKRPTRKEYDKALRDVAELVKALLGLRSQLPWECSCHESYTTREKNLGYRFKDPDCLYCDLDDALKAADAALAKHSEAPKAS